MMHSTLLRSILGGRSAATLTLLVAALASASAWAAPAISGDYLEARTADVYTGPCFANSEVNLAGKEAVLAWHVRDGAWQGVALAGLSVVAALRADATLGDPFGGTLNPRAVLLVDERATPAQQAALIGFAESMAGPLLADVVRVERTPIELTVNPAGSSGPAVHQHAGMSGAMGAASGEASLTAGPSLALRTRSLNASDTLCGNEEIYYPPLTPATAVPAVTVVNFFSGDELGKTWSSPSKRSAFVGHFAR